MALTVRNILLEFSGETRNAQRAVDALEGKLARLPNEKEIRLRADATRAMKTVGTLEKELKSIDRTQVEPEVAVEISAALLKVEAMRRELNSIGSRKYTAQVDVDVDRAALVAIQRDLGGITRTLDRVSSPARSFGDAMGNVLTTVKSVTPFVNGLAILVGVKLVGGLLALGASAMSAVGGVGALATALIAALGPAVVLALGVVNRMAKVLEALKLEDQARDEAQRKSAEGSKAAAQAAEQRKAAEEDLRDAIQGAATAERNLEDAREQARQNISDARDEVTDAQQDIAESAREMESATVNAYREMEDAAERVQDAVLGVESAQLGLSDAKIGIREAEQALRDFAAAGGLAGDQFAQLNKLTDVNADPRQLKEALKAMGQGMDEGEQLEFEKLVLRLRQAKLREKEATDELGDSERDLKRAREDNAGFVQRGISASQSYQAALQAQEQSQERLNDATEALRRLEEDGIDNAPGVIAAAEAQRDAEERLAATRRRSRSAGQDSFTDAQTRAQQATQKLTGAERQFLAVLKQVRGELSGFLGPAVNEVFGGLTRALARAPQLLNPLRGAFHELGAAWGDVIDQFSRELIRPEWVTALRYFVQQSGVLARILAGDAFIAFSRIMRNVALVAMPLLVQLSREFAGWLQSIANSTSDVGKLAPLVNTMVESFRAWARLAGAVGGAVLAIIQAAAPFGDELLGWITDAVKAFTAWLQTAEGQEKVREFFEDTIPSVKALVKFLFTLFKIFLQGLQLVSPILEGMLSVFQFVADVISSILGLLNDIASNPVGRAIRYAVGQFLGLGTVLRIIGLVVRGLAGIAGGLLNAGGKVASYLVRPFLMAFRFIGTTLAKIPALAGTFFARIPTVVGGAIAAGAALLFGAGKRVVQFVLNGVGAVIRGFLSIGPTMLRLIGRGLAAGGRFLFNAGKTILTTIGNGIKALFRTVYDAGRSVVNRIIAGVRSLAAGLFNVGKELLAGLVNGFVSIGKTVFNAIKGLAGKIVDAVKNALGIASPSKVMYQLGQFMLQGLIKGFTSGDVQRFIADHLGGMAKLAVELGTKIAPGGFALDAAQDLLGLAKGGIVNRHTVAQLGEKGKEAVIPLTKAVLRQLGAAIASAMTPGYAPAFAGPGAFSPGGSAAGGHGGVSIAHQDVHLPPVPGGGVLDARAAAAKFAREMKRRGEG